MGTYRANTGNHKTPLPVGDDLFIERDLPSNIEAERSILGAILLDNAVCNQAVEMLRREHLFLESHRRIYEKMVSLNQQGMPIDLVTLADELRRVGEFEQVGGATYIASLLDGVPRTDNIQPYTKLVEESWKLRTILSLCNTTLRQALERDGTASELVGQLLTQLYELASSDENRGYRRISDCVIKQLEAIEQLSSRPGMITGVATGFTDFDQLTAGLQRQDFIVIAARPRVGKTAVALNIGAFAAKNNWTVGIVSLEMSMAALILRLLSSEARVDHQRLRTGYLNRDEWARLADAHRRMCNWELHVDDQPGQTPSQIHAKAKRLQAEHGLDLLIVDYLTLIAADRKSESRVTEVNRISKAMKAIAKDLDVPLIALSQLNRAPDLRTDHRPMLSDLKETGAIEEDADVVAFLYRDELYREADDNRGFAELIIAKQRNGPTGTVHLAFIKDFSRFESMWKE